MLPLVLCGVVKGGFAVILQDNASDMYRAARCSTERASLSHKDNFTFVGKPPLMEIVVKLCLSAVQVGDVPSMTMLAWCLLFEHSNIMQGHKRTYCLPMSENNMQCRTNRKEQF